MTITPTTAHPTLDPFRLGQLELTNRLAVAPMTRVSAEPDGTPTAEMAHYYREFAEGGFGLVIVEGTYTDATHSRGYLCQPKGLVSEAHVAGWRAVVDGVHRAGVPLIAQLMHAGALSQGNPSGHGTIAPSAVKPLGRMLEEYGGAGSRPTPREANRADLAETVAGFVAAAANARSAGFDGVEIHGANGYLLDQFLTAYTNRRSDHYGGDVAARIRLTAEVVGAVVADAPSGFVVGVRLSQTKVNDFVYRWPGGAGDAETIFVALADAGAGYLHVASEGRDFIETARFADGRTITSVAREVSGLPVIANGGMHDLGRAVDVLSGGHADLLSLARGAPGNPDLPRRVASGRALDEFDHDFITPAATIGNTRAHRAATVAR
ncbi:NADH:flavin oxidoreductase [Nocardioides sp. B-3]|uniref:NADH:flavin oxidoreductase n=1 Tax=Nocardioides sp. B-3 TaxID=2895565 RepID=UPI002152969D|nr:NADH:flavin oxidoreductase [Nocardioides sp. B-3]UUZ59930.1 NADH:flavin oxidoreductase [Nocardioides sp. B-3]